MTAVAGLGPIHVPILTGPIVEALLAPLPMSSNAPDDWLVDFTFGGGGHTRALLDSLARARPENQMTGQVTARVLAIDRDPGAIARGKERFAREIGEGRLELRQGEFSECEDLVRERRVLGALADLGFSSDQIEDPARGLSFQLEGPLDMRLDPTTGFTAEQILRQLPEKEIERIIREYGEERFSRRIAAAIVKRRREKSFPRTTTELAELVRAAVPPPARHGRIHPATRTFQAIRIAVNGELEALDRFLERVIMAVQPGGRVAIISFHSLEDRKVKQAFRSDAFRPLTKKPIQADAQELEANPRSRSAKLRIAERL